MLASTPRLTIAKLYLYKIYAKQLQWNGQIIFAYICFSFFFFSNENNKAFSLAFNLIRTFCGIYLVLAIEMFYSFLSVFSIGLHSFSFCMLFFENVQIACKSRQIYVSNWLIIFARGHRSRMDSKYFENVWKFIGNWFIELNYLKCSSI